MSFRPSQMENSALFEQLSLNSPEEVKVGVGCEKKNVLTTCSCSPGGV